MQKQYRLRSFKNCILGYITSFFSLLNQSSQRLPDKFRTYALFGSGKDWPEHSWKALGRRLIFEGFLKEVSGQNKFSVMCMLTGKVGLWSSDKVLS